MDINKIIDHTLLQPDTPVSEIKRLCREAKENEFCAVCVPPMYVVTAKQELQGSSVRVATVIGFPYGYASTMAKVEDIKRAIEEGADEVDVVINLGAVKSGQWNVVSADVDRMVTAIRLRGKQIKVIVETALLSDAELEKICEICNQAKPDFVKTSTGTRGGATEFHVRSLRRQLDPEIKIKASGGIRNYDVAKQMIDAGADRIGTSSGLAIVGK